MKEKQEIIKFSNTPAFYREYVKNWLVHTKAREGVTEAEIAIVEDICKLVNIGVNSLQPVEAPKSEK